MCITLYVVYLYYMVFDNRGIHEQGDDLLIANLGDSRAMLGTRGENGVTAVQLTTDLKPGTPGN